MTALVLLALLFLPVLASAGVEARCTELGANCVCSEPLDATSYPFSGQGQNPNDTSPSDKECTQDWGDGSAIIFNVTPQPVNGFFSVTSGTESAAFAALPSGHSIVRMAKNAETTPNNEGGNFGHILASGEGLGRVSWRWYQFFSSDYQFQFDGSCNNDKLGSMQNSGGTFNEQYVTFGTFEGPSKDVIASHLAEVIGVDCCGLGPAGDHVGGDERVLTNFKGTFWRFELIVRDRVGPGIKVLFYQKDITNDGPELLRVDTTLEGDCQGPCGFPGQPSGGTPSVTINWVGALMHRHLTCNGYRVFTHGMMAAWDTDADQRIGAASEVEGNGAPPPVTARGRIHQLVRRALLLLMIAVGVLLGAVHHGR